MAQLLGVEPEAVHPAVLEVPQVLLWAERLLVSTLEALEVVSSPAAGVVWGFSHLCGRRMYLLCVLSLSAPPCCCSVLFTRHGIMKVVASHATAVFMVCSPAACVCCHTACFLPLHVGG